MNELTHLDCFSGLGAWTLAAHAEAIRTIGFIENDKRCQDFLRKVWPGIPIHGDLRELDGRSFRGADILTAGVPCQPASCAGKRRGSGDDRWLWDEVIRIVDEARPASRANHPPRRQKRPDMKNLTSEPTIANFAGPCENTDRKLWQCDPDNAYSPSIHVTKNGAIGINVHGHVIVMPVEKWHALGELRIAFQKLAE